MCQSSDSRSLIPDPKHLLVILPRCDAPSNNTDVLSERVVLSWFATKARYVFLKVRAFSNVESGLMTHLLAEKTVVPQYVCAIFLVLVE